MLSNFKREFVVKFTEVGQEKFYRFLLSSAILKLSIQLESKDKNERFPDQELLEYYDKFLVFYRRENEEIYLNIARQCRRAAHKIHRELRRQNIAEKNSKFLYAV